MRFSMEGGSEDQRFEVLFLIFVQAYKDRSIADSVKSNQGTPNGHPSSIGRIISLPVFI